MAKRGIDISEHQGNIDLASLKSQIDFVIIRVGYGVSGTIDSKFERNANLCRELGIPVGFYWYSYALDQNGARDEANAMIKAIEPYRDIIKYGVWFDMEDADGYKKRHGMPSDAMLRQICHEFCATTENAGYYSGIYASQSWLDYQLNDEGLRRFDKWVAQWPTSNGKQKGLSVKANSKSNVSLWQFTSVGKFNGYSGNLDTNYAYHDFPNPGSTTPEPIPEVKPVKKSNEEIAKEVMNGDWGNGDERKQKLEDAGYDYNAIQEIVNNNSKKPVTRGSRIKFTGTTSYSGLKLASWTNGSIFDVIEVSGDRVVIGKGTQVTAAVNMRDCQRV